jgi:TolA-binding protein
MRETASQSVVVLAFLALALATVLAACTSMPPADTVNKKMAVFEVSYQNVLEQATRWRVEDRLSEETIQRLDKLFDQIDDARSAAYAALEAGRVDEAENKLQLAQRTLAAARDVLAELERREE